MAAIAAAGCVQTLTMPVATTARRVRSSIACRCSARPSWPPPGIHSVPYPSSSNSAAASSTADRSPFRSAPLHTPTDPSSMVSRVFPRGDPRERYLPRGRGHSPLEVLLRRKSSNEIRALRVAGGVRAHAACVRTGLLKLRPAGAAIGGGLGDGQGGGHPRLVP